MADFTLSKSLFKGKHRDTSSLPGNIAYAVFVLFCFWAGAQVLNLLAHAPGIYEQLMQLQMQFMYFVRNLVWIHCRKYLQKKDIAIIVGNLLKK